MGFSQVQYFTSRLHVRAEISKLKLSQDKLDGSKQYGHIREVNGELLADSDPNLERSDYDDSNSESQLSSGNRNSKNASE
jgi:hypothetical protein